MLIAAEPQEIAMQIASKRPQAGVRLGLLPTSSPTLIPIFGVHIEIPCAGVCANNQASAYQHREVCLVLIVIIYILAKLV